MKKITNIFSVDVELYGECNWNLEMSHPQKGIYLNNKLPHKFEYFSEIQISHKCSNCKNIICWGSDNYVKKTKNINTKFYHEKFILEFQYLLKNTTVINIENDIYIYNQGISYNSITAPIDTIKLGYYQCGNCKKEYLCNSISAPLYHFERPGDGESKLGFIDIKEIIQIELENGKTFGEWEYENRIFKDNVLKQ